MSWARLDDEILDNPKIIRAGPIGFALHVAAITYCARNLTDGFVPYGVARKLLATTWTEDHGDRVKIQHLAMASGMSGSDGDEVIEHIIALLCEVGLWEPVPHGYEVHDYLVYNPSKEQVLAERASKREAGRAGGQRSAQTRRERYGTAQPEARASGVASGPAQPRAQAAPEATVEPESKQRSNPVPVGPVPGPVVPVPGISQQQPLVSKPARGEGLSASADPRTALGDRLVVEIADLVAGGVLSPLDQKRVRDWPWAYQNLARRGESAFLELCRRKAGSATDPIRSVKYFEGPLGEADAAVVDDQSVPSGRSHANGMTSIRDMLPGALQA